MRDTGVTIEATSFLIEFDRRGGHSVRPSSGTVAPANRVMIVCRRANFGNRAFGN